MTEKPEPSTQFSVALSGKMVQFNITLLVLGFVVLGALVVCAQSSNPVITYAGTGVALLALLVLIVFAIVFHIKPKSRPMDGQAVAISMKDKTGNEIVIRNPPDTFFTQEEFKAMARAFMVGYDETLCPDGQVIGNAAAQNYRLYSEEEKKRFMLEHRAQIQGKKVQVAKFLEQELKVENEIQSADTGSVDCGSGNLQESL